LRAALANKNVEVVGINDLVDIDYLAYILKYDSTHGRFDKSIEVDGNFLVIDGHRIRVTSEKNTEELKWDEIQAEYIVDATGLFLTKDLAEAHLKAGAKKVIISAPASNVDATIVQGVNNKILNKKHSIISNGSCTTNCLAPVAMILDKIVGIESGFMTTIHSFTGDQRTVDQTHSDLRRARTASSSLIPTSTGAAKALSLVLPNLEGRLDGTAIRVPTPNVSLIDLTFVSKKKTSIKKINNAMIAASKLSNLKNILTVNNLPLVSMDFNHNISSSIFDLTQT
jgi:glyceraldehyde 3-phosphate dehydrogenase